ncbi:FMN-binding protein [Galbitalea soli]|uniref:FMN-binding protein n=1 Tax=Galbitalea soli TaxID=1268042 RepID=A0A7C9TQ75_9MICO|nr:FMN-binding protein [Galbitalea soli]NYJ30790.1 uncharacterized protein with FMN-binding domain [Galbitalea soli]
MKTRAVLGSIFASASVLVIGWQAGASAAHSAEALTSTGSTGSTTASTATGSGTASTPSSTTSSSPSSTGSASTGGSTASTTKTYTGNVIDTQWGTVQVEIKVKAGKITDVVALKLTDVGGRSVEISNYAAPILRQEVLAAQSANVAAVGGATYTTDGYLQSVQSAIDKAGL